jgi:hypothetical protein
MPYIQITQEEHEMTRYWAHALDRKGRTIGKVGPVMIERNETIGRETVRNAIKVAFPQAHSYSIGRGELGLHFDIRNERNIK